MLEGKNVTLFSFCKLNSNRKLYIIYNYEMFNVFKGLVIILCFII